MVHLVFFLFNNYLQGQAGNIYPESRRFAVAGPVSGFLYNNYFMTFFIILHDINQSTHISANKKINLDKERDIRS
jgi:hypothetical protein